MTPNTLLQLNISLLVGYIVQIRMISVAALEIILRKEAEQIRLKRFTHILLQSVIYCNK